MASHVSDTHPPTSLRVFYSFGTDTSNLTPTISVQCNDTSYVTAAIKHENCLSIFYEFSFYLTDSTPRLHYK